MIEKGFIKVIEVGKKLKEQIENLKIEEYINLSDCFDLETKIYIILSAGGSLYLYIEKQSKILIFGKTQDSTEEKFENKTDSLDDL